MNKNGTTPAPVTAAEWSNAIRASVERTVASIMETGDLLLACQAALKKARKAGRDVGTYTEAVEGAGMSLRVAEMYTRVADNKVLKDPNVHSSLPPSHHVLNELAKLEIPDLEFSVKHGVIRPTMSLGEAKNMVQKFRRSPLNKPHSGSSAKHGRAAAHTEVAETAEFTTIVVDPPWEEAEVPTVSLDELRELTIPAADNAHLYLWLTDSFAPYAYRIVRDWGFTDKTMLTWFKSKRPSGSFDYFRPRTERILFAVKGDFRVPGWRARADDWFEAPIPRKGAGRPKEFYELVEQASPGPYLEIYGRLPRDGWAARWVIDDAQVVDVV